MEAVEYLERLAASLSRLPGVGRRSAARMAYRLISDSRGMIDDLVLSLKEASDHVRFCPQCGNLMTAAESLCRLCASPERNAKVLCIVEDPGDILAIEQSGAFNGRYHALMGRLSPMHGTGPDDLRVKSLLDRIAREGFDEVVLALNTNMESDATAGFISDILKSRKVRVTRLAFGLPAGSGIGYADSLTLSRAIEGRQPV